jgi:hypothetical protein
MVVGKAMIFPAGPVHIRRHDVHADKIVVDRRVAGWS